MKELSGKIIEVIPEADGHAMLGIVRSLKGLRELGGLSEEEMAQRLELSPEVISKIEIANHIIVADLKRYVQALGAELRISDCSSSDAQFLLQLKDIVIDPRRQQKQLVLPMFEDALFRPQRDIILSIRPQYSRKILRGQKTVELRRRFPESTVRGTIAHIYATSPVQAMVGRAEISDIIRLPVSTIWREYAGKALVEKKDFDSYFAGLKEGVALKFENVRQLPRYLHLPELRERFNFEPPQSFLYAKPNLQGALHNEYTHVSD